MSKPKQKPKNLAKTAYSVGRKAWKERFITCFHEQERMSICNELEIAWDDLDDADKIIMAQAWADGNLKSYTEELAKNMASHLEFPNGR